MRAVSALLVFAAVLELCARVDDYVTYGAPVLGVYNSETMYERDAIGKRGKPHARFRKWQLNALGFRGPELDPKKTTIVCFGASETFGLYEREGFEYPRQLERELNERGGSTRFQVLNAAYPGESVHTALLRVPEIVAAARPAAAVVYGAPADYIWLPYLDAKAQPPGPIPQPWFEFRLQERVHNVLKATLPLRLQDSLRAREIRADTTSAHAMDRLPEENIRRYHDDLRAMVAALRSLGVMPILVTHFHAFGDRLTERDRGLLTTWRKSYPMLKEEGFLDMERRMNAAMRQVADEQDVPLIDLSEQVPPGPRNFADFAHLTEAGASIVAEKLAEGMIPLLSTGSPAAANSSFDIRK
jgi:lysophospholipase L1-like esterase